MSRVVSYQASEPLVLLMTESYTVQEHRYRGVSIALASGASTGRKQEAAGSSDITAVIHPTQSGVTINDINAH